jgi:hypothetical protein
VKRAGGVGTDGPAGGADPPPPLGPGVIGDGAPRRGDTTGPGQGTGPGVGPTGSERVPAERGRIGGSTTTSIGKREEVKVRVRGGWCGGGEGKYSLIKHHMARDEDSTRGEVKAAVALVVRGVLEKHTEGGTGC